MISPELVESTVQENLRLCTIATPSVDHIKTQNYLVETTQIDIGNMAQSRNANHETEDATIESEDTTDSLKPFLNKMLHMVGISLDENESIMDEIEKREHFLQKRHHVISELINSEQTYINDLAYTITTYFNEMGRIKEVPIPESLVGKDYMIFMNIDKIYEWHRDSFSKQLESCATNPGELAVLFKKCQNKFESEYTFYCMHKHKADHIVNEHINYFEEVRLKNDPDNRLVITDMLIKPTQRLAKYHMLLKELLKCAVQARLTDEISNLKEALKIMLEIPKNANDMCDVGRIQNFNGNLKAQGKLIHRGSLQCYEGVGKFVRGNVKRFKMLEVFFFDQSLMFCEITGRKLIYSQPFYTFKNMILANKMSVEYFNDENRILIRSIDPSRDVFYYLCTVSSPKLYDEWKQKIEKQILLQKNIVAALSNPKEFGDSNN